MPRVGVDVSQRRLDNDLTGQAHRPALWFWRQRDWQGSSGRAARCWLAGRRPLRAFPTACRPIRSPPLRRWPPMSRTAIAGSSFIRCVTAILWTICSGARLKTAIGPSALLSTCRSRDVGNATSETASHCRCGLRCGRCLTSFGGRLGCTALLAIRCHSAILRRARKGGGMTIAQHVATLFDPVRGLEPWSPKFASAGTGPLWSRACCTPRTPERRCGRAPRP